MTQRFRGMQAGICCIRLDFGVWWVGGCHRYHVGLGINYVTAVLNRVCVGGWMDELWSFEYVCV